MKKIIGLILLSFILLLFSQCDRADTILSVVENAPDSSIFTMAVYNNELYVGGCFGSVGKTKSKYIAKWDGEKWEAVGNGVNYTIISLAVYKDELYAGGICDKKSGNLVKWNG